MHICWCVYILANVGQGRILCTAATRPESLTLTFNSPKGKEEEKKLPCKVKKKKIILDAYCPVEKDSLGGGLHGGV